LCSTGDDEVLQRFAGEFVNLFIDVLAELKGDLCSFSSNRTTRSSLLFVFSSQNNLKREEIVSTSSCSGSEATTFPIWVIAREPPRVLGGKL